MDGRRPRRNHPAPTRGSWPSSRTSDPRWSREWHGYQTTSREILSDTSEHFLPPDAFDRPAEPERPAAPPPPPSVRHRTHRSAPPGRNRWVRQLIVLLPLALASSSWAAFGDTKAPEGGWFPDGYRVALGANRTATEEGAQPEPAPSASPAKRSSTERPDRQRPGSQTPGPTAAPKDEPRDGPAPAPRRTSGPDRPEPTTDPAPPAPAPPRRTTAPKPAPTTPGTPTATPTPTPTPGEDGLPLPRLPLPLPLPTSLPLPLPFLASSSSDGAASTQSFPLFTLF